MKKLLLIIGFVAMTFVCVSCKSDVKIIVEKSNDNPTTEIDSIVEDDLLLTIDKIDISDIENGKVYQDIKYSEITYKDNNPALQKNLDALNARMKSEAESFKEEHKQDIRDYISEYKDIHSDVSEDDIMYAYDSDVTLTYDSDKCLSFVVDTYVYTMGAHGGSIVSAYTYDLKTGKELTLDDFIKDKEELRKYLKDWVAKQEDDMFFPEANDIIDAYFDNKLDLQFTIKEKEFKVIFQQYDIAPYAAGIIEVGIDKSLLKVDLNDI